MRFCFIRILDWLHYQFLTLILIQVSRQVHVVVLSTAVSCVAPAGGPEANPSRPRCQQAIHHFLPPLAAANSGRRAKPTRLGGSGTIFSPPVRDGWREPVASAGARATARARGGAAGRRGSAQRRGRARSAGAARICWVRRDGGAPLLCGAGGEAGRAAA